MAMARLRPPGALTVFVGDGLSDQYAAMAADVVFAKAGLGAFCEQASIAYEPYESLSAVAISLERWLATGRSSPRVFPERYPSSNERSD